MRASDGVGAPYRTVPQAVRAALPFLGVHVACIGVIWFPPTAGLLMLAASGYAIRMWAVTAGYHRYLAHRAYRTGRALQLVLAVLGASALQRGPLWWASWHRRHHKYSDQPGDPHTPRRGFWSAHVGWIFDGTHDFGDYSNVRDLVRYPELRWLDRHHYTPVIAYAFACFAIAGLPGLVWGFAVSSVLLAHAVFMINSVAHRWGTRRFETRDDSRNNALLALMTFGEGWHNNHHHEMTSARQGFRWWEVDLTYYTLRVLRWMRVVWSIREPRAPNTRGGRVSAVRLRE